MKERFLAYIEFEKRYSPHTVTAYRNDLNQFFDYLHLQYDSNDVHEVSPPMIRSWFVYLMEHEVGTRAVNRKLSTLKSFFKFLIREGELTENPVRRIIPPKTSRRLPAFVEKDKMEMLFETNEFGEGFQALRDKTILEMFYGTGMRLSELVNLRETDIDFHNDTLKVLGKRNKERLIPFSAKFKTLLKSYLDCKRTTFGECNDLFLTDSGAKVYPKLIYLVVTRHLGMVTTAEKKSPHVLRHTFATHMLNNGAELNAVKELLGHANLAATQVYTHNTIDKLKSIYKQAHPKA